MRKRSGMHAPTRSRCSGEPQSLAELLVEFVPDLFAGREELIEDIYRDTGDERFIVRQKWMTHETSEEPRQ